MNSLVRRFFVSFRTKRENLQLVPQLQGLEEEHPQLPAILIDLFGG